MGRSSKRSGVGKASLDRGKNGQETNFLNLKAFSASWWGCKESRNKIWRRCAAAVVAIGLPTAFLSLSFQPSAGLHEGDVSNQEIRSPRTVRFVDPDETDKLRQEAAKNVPPQYAPEADSLSSATAKIEGTLGIAVKTAKEHSLDTPGTKMALLKEQLAIELSPVSLTTLSSTEPVVLAGLKQDAEGVVRQVMERPIRQGVSEDLKNAKDEAKQLVNRLPLRQALRGLMVEVCQKAISENFYLDGEATEKAIKEAEQAVRPVYRTFRAGEVIVRAGEIVTKSQLRQLEAAGLRQTHSDLGTILLTLCVIMFLVGVSAVFARRYAPATYDNEGLLLAGGVLLSLAILVFKLFSTAAHPWLMGMMAVATITLVVTVLSNIVVGVVTACSLAILLSMAASNEPGMVPVLVSCGLVSALSVERGKQRMTALVKAGVIVGLVNALMMLVGGALIGLSYEWDVGIARRALFAFFSGPIAAMTAFGIILTLEMLLGVTTSFRLVELSNPHEPLLKELMTKAPGTYHGSFMVANLASAAAEAIGADALLAQVGSYYHDVGKVRRPAFFVENQSFGRNPHKKLLPSLSALVLASHVKDGIEVAKSHRLPKPIIDIIREHHGTTVMAYFHEKALKSSGKVKVEKDDYRYPGPKPHSKEAAIVMLADAVEAAVRSLSEPSPSQIRSLVQTLIKERIADGQLDESGLTFGEVTKVQESLVNNLVGLFHSRIEYPETDELATEKQKTVSNNQKRAEEKSPSADAEEVC